MISQKNKGKEIENEAVIDATQAVLGRLASLAAKQSLLSTRVVIVNSEKAIITGRKQNIFDDYIAKRQRGKGSLKGPYFPSKPADILKRTIRGMLTYKKARGLNAFKKIRCYEGMPEEYATKEKINMQSKNLKYITLKELSERIGRK